MNVLRVIPLAALAVLAGCSGAGVSTTPPVGLAPSPAALQSRQPKRSPIVFSPSLMALFGTGPKHAASVVVSEADYKGRFTVRDNCGAVAGIRPARGRGPAFGISGKPLHTGKCTVVVSDAKHHSAKLAVTVRPAAGTLRVRIAVPKGSSRRFRRVTEVRPNYVSPNTQAVAITTTGGPTQVTVTYALSDLASGCSENFGELSCVLNLDLAPCPASGPSDCYTAGIAAYDSYDGTTSAVPPGAALLSVASGLTFGIDANEATSLKFDMSGVPTRVAVVSADGTSTVSASGTIVLNGPGTHAFYAEAYDADGNKIAGLGAPDFGVAASPSGGVTLSTPPPGSPRFSLMTPAHAASYVPKVTLSVTASYPSTETDGCAPSGAACTAQYAMAIPAPITSYPLNFTMDGLTSGPDGNLWFTARYNDLVGKMTTSGTVTEYTAGISPNSGVLGITAGPDGKLWFTECSAGRVASISTSGTVTEYSNGISGQPLYIVAGSDGNLWFSEGATGIGKITTLGAVTEYSIPGGSPFGITLGPDHNIWFGLELISAVGRITPDGNVNVFDVPGGAHQFPAAPFIAAGSDGNLWFTRQNVSGVGKITTSGNVTEYPSSCSNGQGIVGGPDGNVWCIGGAGLVRIAPDGSETNFVVGTGVLTLTVGPDKNLWFTGDSSINKLQM